MKCAYYPRKARPIYGFYKGDYIGVMSAKDWANMHNTGLSMITERARKQKPLGDWFFSYENKYEPKVRHEYI